VVPPSGPNRYKQLHSSRISYIKHYFGFICLKFVCMNELLYLSHIEFSKRLKCANCVLADYRLTRPNSKAIDCVLSHTQMYCVSDVKWRSIITTNSLLDGVSATTQANYVQLSLRRVYDSTFLLSTQVHNDWILWKVKSGCEGFKFQTSV